MSCWDCWNEILGRAAESAQRGLCTHPAVSFMLSSTDPTQAWNCQAASTLTSALVWATQERTVSEQAFLPAGPCSRDRSCELCIVGGSGWFFCIERVIIWRCVVIKAIGYLLSVVSVVSFFFFGLQVLLSWMSKKWQKSDMPLCWWENEASR